jgi:hypothetical protein
MIGLEFLGLRILRFSHAAIAVVWHRQVFDADFVWSPTAKPRVDSPMLEAYSRSACRVLESLKTIGSSTSSPVRE